MTAAIRILFILHAAASMAVAQVPQTIIPSTAATNAPNSALQPGATITFTDLMGRTFKEAQVLRVESGVVVIMTSHGINRVSVNLLPEHLRPEIAAVAQSKPPPAGDASTADRVSLASLDAQIARMRQERTALQSKHDEQKTRLEARIAELTKRYTDEYKAMLKAQAEEERGRSTEYRYNRDGNRRSVRGYSVHLPPKLLDANDHPDVIRMKELVAGYANQIADREKWLSENEPRRNEIASRVRNAGASGQRSDAANQEAEDAKRPAETSSQWAESEKAEEERSRQRALARELADKERAEERERSKQAALADAAQKQSEWRDDVHKAVAEIRGLITAGDIRNAFIRLYGISSDQRILNRTDPEAIQILTDVALEVAAAARTAGEIPLAARALKTAISIGGRSAATTGSMVTLFDELRLACRKGDTETVAEQFPLLDLATSADFEGCMFYRREMSSTAIGVAQSRLLVANIPGALHALGVARDLWPTNPKLGSFRLTLVLACLVFVGAVVLIVVKVAEKSYRGWLHR
ncbi:MAG TPA: hypothetical protein PLU30_05570 [Verrucomicrobiae bacterium]|nr:hypothetical protein [Verrucomicrobiae bacterium]